MEETKVAEANRTLSEALDRAQLGQPTLEVFNICAEYAEQLSEIDCFGMVQTSTLRHPLARAHVTVPDAPFALISIKLERL